MDILPRKISAEESCLESVTPVLFAFFGFLEEKGLLRNTSKVAEGVKKIDRQIVKNASNLK